MPRLSRNTRWQTVGLRPAVAGLAVVGLALVSGCNLENGFFDPTQLGRFNHDPLVVKVLPNLDMSLEQPDQRFVTAREVREADLKAPAADYVIGPNDELTLTIGELQGPGTESVVSRRVSESGKISLQLVGQIPVSGLTEAQVEEAVVRAYREAGIIQDAHVTATVTAPRNKTFSVIGSVNAPGEYAILKTPTRLLDALVAARDTSLPDLEELYVLRRTAPVTAATQPATREGRPAGPRETGPVIPEPGAGGMPRGGAEAAPTQPAATTGEAGATATRPGDGERYVMGPDGKPMLVGGTTDAATAPVQAEPFEFDAPMPPTDQEVIRVPLMELKNGQFQYNIAIHAGDTIIVPPPVIGEYYMAGNVARPGPYSLTNRKITLKQAIAGAGLSPLAIPERTELVRRLSDKKEMKEVFVRVDLAKIVAGQEPDIVLKPYDVVNVGSNALAPFVFALRNAFRITYGFGFVYDRNFFEPNNNTN